jgi:hypothetical protein
MNIVLRNQHWDEALERALFGNLEGVVEPINHIQADASFDMYDALILLGVFNSRSQARKNWKGTREFPPGFTHFSVGKLRTQFWVWNPVQE